jgi:hypothetical protein
MTKLKDDPEVVALIDAAVARERKKLLRNAIVTSKQLIDEHGGDARVRNNVDAARRFAVLRKDLAVRLGELGAG